MTTRRNKRTITLRGGFEPQIVAFMDENDIDFASEPVKLDYIMHYKPDFQLPNGIFIEAKGYFPSEDRQKMLAVKKTNPDLDIRFIFQTPHRKCPGLKTLTCVGWAEKHGFKWMGPKCESLIAWYKENPKND